MILIVHSEYNVEVIGDVDVAEPNNVEVEVDEENEVESDEEVFKNQYIFYFISFILFPVGLLGLVSLPSFSVIIRLYCLQAEDEISLQSDSRILLP